MMIGEFNYVEGIDEFQFSGLDGETYAAQFDAWGESAWVWAVFHVASSDVDPHVVTVDEISIVESVPGEDDVRREI